MAKNLTITTIVKKAGECVIYNDDGWYCSWTEKKAFNFDLIAETKAEATGIVLLVSEDEMANFKGETIAFDDHKAWCIPKWLIWNVYGELPVEEDDQEVVDFMRSCII